MSDLAGFKQKCEGTIDAFKREIGKLRSGRASTSLLEDVSADYYGAKTPLKQLGTVSAPEARMLTVQVYDAGAVQAVEKAIIQAELGLNPQSEGTLIRVPIPTLTEERRKDLIKKAGKIAEEYRIAVRNNRRDAIDVVKKQEKGKEISEDDSRKVQEDIQKVTDTFIAQINEHFAAKEKEMLEV